MRRQDLATLALVGCCVLAIGASATAMTSAVDTTPDDVINLRYDSIPLEADTVDRLKDRLQEGEGETREQVAGGDRGETSSDANPGGGDRGPGGSQGELSSLGSGLGPGEDGRLDRLWAWLDRLLFLLLVLLALIAPVTLVWLAVKHADRLRALLRSLRAGGAEPRGAPALGDTPGAPPGRPENDVAAAYFELVRRLGLADRLSVTPGECADTAVGAGVDPGPVERLTGLFEEVRYGGADVTERHRRRSRQALEEILDQLPVGPHR